MDRRALFFLGAATLCFVLVPLADSSHRVVAIAVGLVYIVLAGLSALDHISRSGR